MRAKTMNWNEPHTIDPDELLTHLRAERWAIYASSGREKKRLEIMLGRVGFRVTVNDVEIYRGQDVSDAVRAYNEARQERPDHDDVPILRGDQRRSLPGRLTSNGDQPMAKPTTNMTDDDADDVQECRRCNASGEVAIDAATGRFRAPGPVPDDAKGVAVSTCDQCSGTGYVAC